MRTLVGSQALLRYFSDFYRQVDDVDYFSDVPIEDADTFYHPDLEKWSWSAIATLDELYTIKVSHSFWQLRNNSWNKHMRDIQFMQEKGAYFLPELHEVLYPIWEKVHGRKRDNIHSPGIEDLIATDAPRYDHDSIHASIAYSNEPLYNTVLKDGHTAVIDRKKFEELSMEDKFKLIREEVYAMALEKYLIPNRFTGSKCAAYKKALRYTVTRFSKGWLPLFIVLNWTSLCEPDADFVQRFRANSHKLVELKDDFI